MILKIPRSSIDCLEYFHLLLMLRLLHTEIRQLQILTSDFHKYRNNNHSNTMPKCTPNLTQISANSTADSSNVLFSETTMHFFGITHCVFLIYVHFHFHVYFMMELRSISLHMMWATITVYSATYFGTQ